MKALVRNEGETITEEMNVDGVDWTTGAPLTNENWCGGSYILVNNYVAPIDDSEESYTVTEEETDDSEDTVVINGVTYTKAELRALLGDE